MLIYGRKKTVVEAPEAPKSKIKKSTKVDEGNKNGK